MSWDVKIGEKIYAYMYEDNKYVYKEFEVTDIYKNEWYKQYVFWNDSDQIAFNCHRANWDRHVFCVDYIALNTYVVTTPKYRYDIFAKSKKDLDRYLKEILEKQLNWIRNEKNKLVKEEIDVLERMKEHDETYYI